MKKTVLWILLDLVFLAVFNIVFFLIGGTVHSASVWISYGFIHFAYLLVIATPLLIRKSSSAAVFGLSIYSISSAYFLVEFVIGLFFILKQTEALKVPIVTQVVIAGIYAVILLSNLLVNEHTADVVKKQEAEISYIKTAASRVKLLMGKVSDKKADKAIEKAYDMLHSSPTKSIYAVHSIETQVINKVAELEEAVLENRTADVAGLSMEIIQLLEERNSELRLVQ